MIKYGMKIVNIWYIIKEKYVVEYFIFKNNFFFEILIKYQKSIIIMLL